MTRATSREKAVPCSRKRRASVERLVVVSRGWCRQRADVAAAQILFRRRLLAAQRGFPGADQRAVQEMVDRENRSLRH
jgi:hypothetical protein